MRWNIVTRLMGVCLSACMYSEPIGLIYAQHGGQVITVGTNQSAQVVLENALQVLGGIEGLKKVDSIFVKGKGREFRSADLQGPDPTTPTEAFHEETIAVLPAQNRLLYEHRTGRHDGSFRWRRWAYAGEGRTVADFRDGFISNSRDPSAPRERARVARTIPHLLLIEAASSAETLRPLRSQMYEGKSHDVISFPLPDTKTSLELFIASDTHLLSKYQYTMDFPGLGDTVVEFAYSAYRREPKLGWVPGGYRILVAGQTFREIQYTEFEVDSSKATAAFQLPEQMASVLLPLGEATEVAQGVFIFVNGSLNPMFIEFKDFILAIEAPAQAPSLERVPADAQQSGSDQMTELFIRKIKEKIPNKPIRYLAVTHFHSDHAGGARAFMAEGATILTTPGNKEYFEKLAAAKYSVMPDRLSQQTRPVSPVLIETFDTKRVITDGDQVVELLNLGRSPHVQENVVAYLPKQKILFQGDLFYFNGPNQFPTKDPSRDKVMKFFGEWLIKNKLDPERIYGFHDRGFATMQEVRQMLSLERSNE